MKRIETLMSIGTLVCAGLMASCSNDKDNFVASGSFEATEVIVSAEQSGRLMVWNVDEGNLLKSQEQVGLIDTTQLYLKLLQIEKNIGVTRTKAPDTNVQVASLREQIANAVRERTRMENLVKVRAANQKQLDDATDHVKVLQKQLDAQLSTLNKSNRGVNEESSALQVQIAQMQDMLDKCHVKAPIDGTVLANYAEQGEFVAAGKPLFKLADMGNIFLRAYVTSDQISELKLNQTVKVRVDKGAKESRLYNGRITWISDKAEFTPKTVLTRDERANQVYAMKVAVTNDGYLKIGQYGEIIK
jgi:HlyD family secretion protein